MNSFSIVGFLIITGMVFMVLKAGNNHAFKTDGVSKETNTKLVWVAVMFTALLGLLVVTGDIR
ncbi:MAG: hypothetical protein GM48_0940 [actinobacterium acIB-AMD-7]|nr:MAG: hypothetical protein GM48_0940 [actinobacterium acIB-AMD-7]